MKNAADKVVGATSSESFQLNYFSCFSHDISSVLDRNFFNCF